MSLFPPTAADEPMPPPVLPAWLVVMGVSGCGKSTLAAALAHDLGLPFVEGDEFHSSGSIEKMRRGQPLDDADRQGWLQRLADQIAAHRGGLVLTCSALKKAYRDELRAAEPALRFVYMAISRADAEARVAARGASHIFPATLVANQFETLQSPVGEPGVIEVCATAAVRELTRSVRSWLASPG